MLQKQGGGMILHLVVAISAPRGGATLLVRGKFQKKIPFFHPQIALKKVGPQRKKKS